MNRFWSKVNKTDGCWEWTASLDTSGYGLFRYKGILNKAHRFCYENFVGPIPKGKLMCHKCDNPKCVRPDHLFIGTHQDNVDDRESKGRGVTFKEEKHNMAKLDKTKVRKIREMYETGGYSLRHLGELHNVNATTIHSIIKKRTWGNV